jgi:hypothetical protein
MEVEWSRHPCGVCEHYRSDHKEYTGQCEVQWLGDEHCACEEFTPAQP